MNVLVIEDEKHNADRIIRLLHGYDDDITVFGPLTSIAEIRSFLHKGKKIDLILSDIRLTDGLSFDALANMNEATPVIFTTAYDEYAIKAFNYNGVAYLLKPIDKDELAEAIERFKRQNSRLSYSSDLANIYRLIQEKRESYRQRFLVVDKDGYMALPVSDISYIATVSGVVRLYMKNGEVYNVDMSLDDIERQLDPMMFFRATRQHIVNISSVRRISNWFNRKIKIVVAEYPETEIVVGKEKVTRLKQWLDR